jgi:hypothetical protein
MRYCSEPAEVLTKGLDHPQAEVNHDRRKNRRGRNRPTQQWCDAMKTQVHNIIVSTLEASETMLEEVDPDSDSDELRIELMAVALNAVAAMGGGTKEHFMEMAKNAAKEYLDGTMRMTPSEPAQRARRGGLLCRLEKRVAMQPDASR